MKNHVYLSDNKIIWIDVCGPQTEDSVRLMGKEVLALAAQLRSDHKKVYILDNLKLMAETTSEARREVARLAKQIDFDRGAMVGSANPLMRHSTNLMLRAIGKSNLRYFASFDAAELWLGA